MLRAFPAIRRSVPDYLLELNRRHGDSVLLPLRYRTFLIVAPEDIRHVLVINPLNYHKAGGLTFARDLLGRGLVSSEPPLHTRQRRLMAPSFHRRAIAGFADLMRDATAAHVASWQHGLVVDLSLEMMTLALGIAGRALFGVDLQGAAAADFGLAFTRVQKLLIRRQRQVPLPLWLPIPSHMEYRRDIARINAFIGTLVSARRRLPEQPADLLGLLLSARDENGAPMADDQLRDEVTTLLLAGHETVANHLNWTFYELSRHPHIEARLLQEWARVIGDRPATLEDLSSLPLTETVLMESLRLYPPAWTLARHVVRDDRLPSGLTLRAGDEVLMSQYVSHRNAKYFPEPERFDPDRWTPEFRRQAPVTAYFPFGVGPRYCIGDAFARMEAALILVTIGRQFALRPIAGQRIEKEALIVMRPRYGMQMMLAERGLSGEAVAV